GIGLDKDDVRPRCHGMCPFHIQTFLCSPGAIIGRERGAARLVDHGEARRRGDAIHGIEGLEITVEVGLVVGIDNGNGLAAAIAFYRAVAEGDLIEPIGLADLAWGEALRVPRRARRRYLAARHRLSDWGGYGILGG